MLKQKLVVIGNGMAGARAVEEVLVRGGADQFEITMFGDEPYGNYNRIMLSNILSGIQDSSEIFINPLDWYIENNITLHAGARITDIDRAARMVLSDTGIKLHYDKLLIATGSRAFIPPMEGARMPDGTLKDGVFGFRTLDDCSGIMARAKGSRKAAVIGGGLLGLEAARGLMNHGCEVHVIHIGDRLMPAQLDSQGAAMLRAGMEKMGITIHLGKSTTAVLGERSVTGLAFKDGTTLDCDMVVVAAGIRPNAEIGMRAGLTVERAIAVDNQMRSVDDQNIYVVGECAQHRGKVYGLVAPLWDQAKVFADHVTGTDTTAAYHGSKLATKLKVMGVELASMGLTDPAEDGDETVQFVEPGKGIYKKLIVRDGRLVGAILMGEISKAAFLMQAFDRDSRLPDERLSLLFDLGAPPQKITLDEMPAETQVCNCNGVTKAAIGGCVAAGSRTATAVMKATRAGMGCGSCKSLVSELVDWFCGGTAEQDPSVHYYVPGIPLTKPELVKAVREQGLRSVSSVFGALGGGIEDAASKPALASMLATIWADEYEDERDARFINDRVHGNIQKDGTFSVMPEMPGGVCTPAQLKRIATVAEDFNVPLVKVTGGQRIDLVGVAKQDLPAVWEALDMPAGWAWGKSYRTCKSCIGTEFCRFGLGDSMGLAKRIEQRFRGLDTPGKDEAGDSRMPAQLLGGDGQGRRRRRHRRGPVGDLYRRRRRRACPQGRPDVHGDRRRRRAAVYRPFHAILPRKREIQGTQLHLRRTHRAGANSRRSDAGQRRHRRGTGRRPGKIRRRDVRPLDRTRRSENGQPV